MTDVLTDVCTIISEVLDDACGASDIDIASAIVDRSGLSDVFRALGLYPFGADE